MIARVLLRVPGALRVVRWLAGVAALLTLLAAAASTAGGAAQPAPTTDSDSTMPSVVSLPVSLAPETYDGHTAKQWHDRYLAQRTRATALKRTMLHRPSVAEALNLACAVYGGCATLWRRARCETGGTLDPRAANRHSSARGLLQFLTTGPVHRYGDHLLVDGGTWATTPFWRFSVFSPYANALAAGWMIYHGRGGEWDCR